MAKRHRAIRYKSSPSPAKCHPFVVGFSLLSLAEFLCERTSKTFRIRFTLFLLDSNYPSYFFITFGKHSLVKEIYIHVRRRKYI